jgi:hypothetical protein
MGRAKCKMKTYNDTIACQVLDHLELLLPGLFDVVNGLNKEQLREHIATHSK